MKKPEFTAGDRVTWKGHEYKFLSEYINIATIKNNNGDTETVRTDKLMRIKS